MSEKQDSVQVASSLPSARGKLTLLKSLIILVIIYGAGEVLSQFVALKAPGSIPWLELGQWVLTLFWLLLGVRPPFMRWLKQQREHKE